MPAPYSYDLRQKALEAFDNGQSQSEVSRNFAINRNTLGGWLKRRKETGEYRALTGFQKGCNHKIKDLETFRKFVKQNGDKTQTQIAKLWEQGLTQQNVSDAMQKLGITRKKKLMAIESGTNNRGKNLKRNSNQRKNLT